MNIDKYRAYDRLNNRMVYYTWEDLVASAVATGYCNHEIPNNIHDLINIAEYNYSEWMRMRYMGTVDRNNKEIYDGDILKRYYGFNNDGTPWLKPSILKVVIENCCFGYYWLGDDVCIDETGFYPFYDAEDGEMINQHDLEIIGNVCQGCDNK